jgi:hypothetical protein
MTKNDKKEPENDDFQGFSEDLAGAFRPKPPLSREAQEVLADMQKRLGRVQRAMLTYQRKPPYALQCEEEALRANIAHFKRRWGVD